MTGAVGVGRKGRGDPLLTLLLPDRLDRSLSPASSLLRPSRAIPPAADSARRAARAAGGYHAQLPAAAGPQDGHAGEDQCGQVRREGRDGGEDRRRWDKVARRFCAGCACELTWRLCSLYLVLCSGNASSATSTPCELIRTPDHDCRLACELFYTTTVTRARFHAALLFDNLLLQSSLACLSFLQLSSARACAA